VSAALTYMQDLLAKAILWRAQQEGGGKQVTIRDAKGVVLWTNCYAIVRELTKKEQDILASVHEVVADSLIEIPRQTVAEGVFTCTGIFPQHVKITYGDQTYEVIHVSHDDVEIATAGAEQQSAMVDCYCVHETRGAGEGV
jgi:hypothetical protein